MPMKIDDEISNVEVEYIADVNDNKIKQTLKEDTSKLALATKGVYFFESLSNVYRPRIAYVKKIFRHCVRKKVGACVKRTLRTRLIKDFRPRIITWLSLLLYSLTTVSPIPLLFFKSGCRNVMFKLL